MTPTMAALRVDCLQNLVVFYDGVSALADRGRTTDIICLALCNVFDAVLQATHVSTGQTDLMDGPLIG